MHSKHSAVHDDALPPHSRRFCWVTGDADNFHGAPVSCPFQHGGRFQSFIGSPVRRLAAADSGLGQVLLRFSRSRTTALTSRSGSITALPNHSQEYYLLVLNGRFQAVSGSDAPMKEKSRYETHHLISLLVSLQAQIIRHKIGHERRSTIFAPPRMGYLKHDGAR